MNIKELKNKINELESKDVCRLFRSDCVNCPIFSKEENSCMITIIDCNLLKYK